ncbi:BrnA antitoxin family protein [Candidatus Nitrospira bockiana]
MRRVGRPRLGDRPRKLIAIRLDQQVLDWLKATAAKRQQPYQSLINEILMKKVV